MKKKLKIVVINVLLIVLVLALVECISFKILQSKDKNFHYIFSEHRFDDNYNAGDFHRQFRPVEIKNNKKGSIILFGCCMTYGVGINDNSQTISHIMANLTGRTVYNRAIPGWGLQHMYYQLTDPRFPSEIKVKPEYIIYTIIKDHYRRLFSNSSANEPYYLTYSVKNNKLVKNPDSFLNRSLFVYLLKELYCEHHYDSKLVDFYILESQKAAKKLYPNVKFVVLNLDDIKELNDDKLLRDNGIQVVNVPKVSETKTIHELPEYWGDNSGHPSGKYWELVLPKVIKEIKIN